MSIHLLRDRSFSAPAKRCFLALLCSLFALSAWAAAESFVWLGLPVNFKAKEYAFRSGPALELQKVQLQTTQPIQVGRVWLTPDWGRWLAEFNMRQLRAEADEIVATPGALMRLGISDGPSQRRITSLHFARLKLVLKETTLELPAGEMDFSDDATLSRIRMELGSGVQLALIPNKDRLELSIQTERLNLNMLPGLVFDSAVASGSIDDEGVSLDKLGASAEGGAVSGSVRIGLTAEKASLAGELEFKSLDAKRVLEHFYPKHVVAGQLYANLKIASEAKTLVELKDVRVQAAGNFTMRGASIDRFGLVEGMRKNDLGVAGGGLVRTESFNGSFSGAGANKTKVAFSGIKSGGLEGWGNFTIDTEGKLAGMVGGSMHMPGREVVKRNFVLEGKASAPVMVRR